MQPHGKLRTCCESVRAQDGFQMLDKLVPGLHRASQGSLASLPDQAPHTPLVSAPHSSSKHA